VALAAARLDVVMHAAICEQHRPENFFTGDGHQIINIGEDCGNTYAKRAFEKLGVGTRRQLVALVLRSAPTGYEANATH